MPPRLNILSASRSIPYRRRPQSQWVFQPGLRAAPVQCRAYSDSNLPNDRSKKSSAQPLEHITEESAKTAEIIGNEGPDIDQGTPVQEVVKGDKQAQEKLPKVMQESLKTKLSGSTPKGSRSYSTSTTPTSGTRLDLGLVDMTPFPATPAVSGLKFEMPKLPLPKDGHVKHRYDDVVDQVTNLLMRHGRKSAAQRNMSLILQHLRTSPIPTVDPTRPLIPGAPPPSHLPLNPVLYLTLAIDSVAPLVRIRRMKGAAGGGAALEIPVPLGQRQRRRTAVQWILAQVSKRKSRGSGKGGLAQRMAEELVSVVEGRSAVWDRRNALHRVGVAARANIVMPKRR
ncbi:ribosomal protein S7 [Lojkania enalia]|uniref:Small ribosomal subunit protein uS7m n=1 Tax=Lojkania enalia TaxID=147567 RepID=A0A9P4K9M8_9PLEO|nr:ribosomal protein S7 [Didymosphaeria enalia]